jgi:1-acyl-sn-glycerol-3-phosphate acyltransferase
MAEILSEEGTCDAAAPRAAAPGRVSADRVPDRWYHECLRRLIRIAARAAFAVLARLRVEGAEHVPSSGGVILAPNHVSAADWPAVGVACPRALRWMAKTELFEVPVIGPFCRLFRAFPVRRGTADRASLRLAEEILLDGHALVIFPEGAVSENATLQPFKAGIALVALRTGVPVVPIGVLGTERLLPYGSNIPRPVWKPVRVRFGPPLRFDDLWCRDAGRRAAPPRAAIEAATARTEVAIRSLLQE